MTSSKHNSEGAARQIHVVRMFDAPRELVFRNWTEPDLIASWFAPDTFSVTASQLDARPGGKWRVEYRSNTGDTFAEWGELSEIVPPEKVVMTLTQQSGSGSRGPETRVTVTLETVGTQTRMTFLQTGFDSEHLRDSNAEGWNECFSKLEASLASTQRG